MVLTMLMCARRSPGVNNDEHHSLNDVLFVVPNTLEQDGDVRMKREFCLHQRPVSVFVPVS